MQSGHLFLGTGEVQRTAEAPSEQKGAMAEEDAA